MSEGLWHIAGRPTDRAKAMIRLIFAGAGPMVRSIHHLRGFAAIAIVAFHAGIPIGGPQLYSAVALFFVISGFVIYRATMARAFDPRSYAWRRFVRVMPLWWIALAWFVGFNLIADIGSRPDVGHVLASLVLLPTEGANGMLRPVLNVGWTLVYEVFFYALFGASVWLGRWWLSSAVILGLVACGWVLEPSGFYARVYTSQIMLCFVAGTLVAHIWSRGQMLSPWLLPAGLLMLLLDEPLARVTAGAFIVAGAVASDAGWFRSKVCDFLGDASYAIYLFHFSITFFAERLTTPPHWTVVFAAALAFGCLAHVLVEKPLLGALRRQHSSQQRVKLGSGGLS